MLVGTCRRPDFPAAVRDDYLTKIFDPQKGLGMNVVRYNIGGGESPSLPNSMEYRARIPGYQAAQGVWDWNADANQRLVLLRPESAARLSAKRFPIRRPIG